MRGAERSTEPYDATIGGLIASRAAVAPEGPGIGAVGRASLSAGELLGLVRRVRTVLRERGVGPTGRVALVVRNGPEAASAFLAISASAACAPLNPAYGRVELEFALTDMRADALVVGAGLETPARSLASDLGLPLIELEPVVDGPGGLFALIGHDGWGETPDDGTQPDSYALLLHTSGTTARPKLVPLTHDNLLASARNVAATLTLDHADVCLNVMPLFHIHGLVAALLASVRAGGSVVCLPGLDARRFPQDLRAVGATWFTAVPTMHQSVLAQFEREPGAFADLRLRFARSSSAALPVAVLEQLESALAVPLVEAYGMTEAAHQMASNPLPPGSRRPGSVGPAAGPSVAILGADGGEVGACEVGEVVIQGENVFAGYEGNPAANAESFVDGWFRTGDEGWLDDAGYLHLRGRLKEIINRGGEKVSPLEVDSVLLEHPAVRAAVTYPVADPRVGEEVAAAVVLDDAQPVTERELQDFVVNRLAPFKVPRRIAFVDEIPKGPTGKVQRLRLPELLDDRGPSSGQPVEERPPGTALEIELARLWAASLDLPSVGMHDDFFALGGDSFRAAGIVMAVRDLLGMPELPLISIVRSPTVAGFAAEVSSEVEESSDTLVEFGAGGKRRLFFVHGVYGDVVGFAALASRLPADVGLVGIRAAEAHGATTDAYSIEAIASEYLDEILAAQSEGPFLVGGFCMGGPVAIEIARRLRRGGEQVGVVLLDPRIRPPRDVRSLSWTIRRRLREPRLREVVVRRLRGGQDPRPWGISTPSLDRLERARDRYRLTEMGAPAVMIRSAGFAGMGVRPSYWSNRLPGLVASLPVAPDHGDLFRVPYVDEVADRLGAALSMLS